MIKKSSSTRSFWIMILSALIIFSFFIFLITRPSEFSLASENTARCSNIADLEKLWFEHSNLQNDTAFVNVIRSRILQISPDSTSLARTLMFLPPRPKYINLIIVPDLSRRIIDSINNPNQSINDIKLLNIIFKNFESSVKNKGLTKDQLMVDLTDPDQASGKFREIADSLVFTPYISKSSTNRKYFEGMSKQFEKHIDSLYKLAVKNPVGADFTIYFNRKLENHIKKSNIFEEYRNIVIILTDGYLEAEHNLYTGSEWQLAKICNDHKKGISMENSIDSAKIWIPSLNQRFRDTEVFLFEINERKKGQNCDFDILRIQWKKWLLSMGIKNVNEPFFFQNEDAILHSSQKIKDLLNK
jgi:hypothetical protein